MRPPVFAALAVALAAVAFFIAPTDFFPSISGSTASWKGYRVLLVDSRSDEKAVLERLKAAGAWPAIALSTQPVLVSDWARPVETTLDEALRTLIPGDPRLDPYIARLRSWFEARIGDDAYRVLYLPRSRASVATISRVMEDLGIEYALPESDTRPTPGNSPSTLFVLCAAVIATAIALSSLFARSSTLRNGGLRLRPYDRVAEAALFRAAMAAPFAAIAWKGGWASFAATLWALAVMDFADPVDSFLRELSYGRGAKRAFQASFGLAWPPFLILASALGSVVVRPSIAPAIAAGLASSAAASVFVSKYLLVRRRRFSPIAIGDRRLKPGHASASRAALACVVILTAAISALRDDGTAVRRVTDEGIAYPTPVALPGQVKVLPAEASARLLDEAIDGRLPGLATWLAHLAFQEAIPYARLGEKRADPFASIVLPSIEGPGLRLDFDDDWARRAYRGLEAASLESMLATQDAATTGALSNLLASRPGNRPPLAPMSALLYILLLIPPLVRVAAGITISRAASTSGVRQEA